MPTALSSRPRILLSSQAKLPQESRKTQHRSLKCQTVESETEKIETQHMHPYTSDFWSQHATARARLAARAPPPVFVWRARKGKVNRTWRRRGGFAVDVRALLWWRGGACVECCADVVAESGVGQEGEALARVECGRRHVGDV